MPDDMQSFAEKVKADLNNLILLHNPKLIDHAPEMYKALRECAGFIEDVICRNCDCSLELDAENLRDYIKNILARIDGTKEED